MKSNFLSYPSLSQFAFPFALALMVSLNASHATEETEDPYDNALRTILQNHSFNQNLFIEQQGTVPLYDITKASSERAHQLHLQNLKNSEEMILPPSMLRSNTSQHVLFSHMDSTFLLSSTGGPLVPSGSYIDQPFPESSSYVYPLSLSSTGEPLTSSWSYWDYPWYALESIKSIMPIGWPNFYGSPDTPTSRTNLGDSFYLIDDTSKPQGTYTPIDTGAQNFSTKSEATTHPDDLLGLSLDGGGVRGLMPAMWIERLERETKQPVSKIFHLIGGTSIGGIGALVLAATDDGKTPRMSGGNLAELIEKHSDEIFPQPSRYNLIARLWAEIKSLRYSRYPTGPLEGLLKKHVGDLTLANSLTRILVTAVNSNTVAPRVFDSANPTDQICKMWELGLCTSAAPTFFPAHLLNGQYYIDGGISKNNPGLDVLKGLGEMPTFSLNQTTILSLGTGNMPLGKIPSDAGISSVGTIVDALIATQSRSVEMTLGTLLPKEGYYRANPTFDRSISLDQLDEETLRLLKEGAESQYGVIDEFVASDSVRKRLERIAD